MILKFDDARPDELAEILWATFTATRLIADSALLAELPRPEWDSQAPEVQTLWRAYAARLLALYAPR